MEKKKGFIQKLTDKLKDKGIDMDYDEKEHIVSVEEEAKGRRSALYDPYPNQYYDQHGHTVNGVVGNGSVTFGSTSNSVGIGSQLPNTAKVSFNDYTEEAQKQELQDTLNAIAGTSQPTYYNPYDEEQKGRYKYKSKKSGLSAEEHLQKARKEAEENFEKIKAKYTSGSDIDAMWAKGPKVKSNDSFTATWGSLEDLPEPGEEEIDEAGYFMPKKKSFGSYREFLADVEASKFRSTKNSVPEPDPDEEEEAIINIVELADSYAVLELERTIPNFKMDTHKEDYDVVYAKHFELISSFKRNKNV